MPVSVWANANPSCSTGSALLGSGDWATCEYHEWYESDEIPADMGCENPSCSCAKSEAISYTVGVDELTDVALAELEREITRRRGMEEELRRHRDELEQLVASNPELLGGRVLPFVEMARSTPR